MVREGIEDQLSYHYKVSSVHRHPQGGLTFSIRYPTGRLVRVMVAEAEPSPRFYPEEGEPDKREKKEFRETFENE